MVDTHVRCLEASSFARMALGDRGAAFMSHLMHASVWIVAAAEGSRSPDRCHGAMPNDRKVGCDRSGGRVEPRFNTEYASSPGEESVPMA